MDQMNSVGSKAARQFKSVGKVVTINSQSIRVYERDENGNVLRCSGTVSITNAGSGYAKGCLYIKTDAGAGTEGVYRNIGTTTSCEFQALDTIVASEVALARGNMLRGGSGGAAEALDTSGDGKFAIGDGTDLNAVTMSGDGTLANDGTFTASAALKTDLVTVALMGTVAEFTFPFNVETRTEAAAAYAKAYDEGTTTYTALSVTAGNAEYTANYQLFPDTETVDDAIYFGSDSVFGVIYMDMSATVAVYGNDALTWEYWDGAAWQTLTIVWDQTDSTANDGKRSFQQDGEIIFSAPTDWASTSVDGQAAYWIRARVTAAQITTIPLTNSKEHHLVTDAVASEMPASGTIGRTRISWVTTSGANNDTKVILCNLTNGECSAVTTLTQALRANEVADWGMTCSVGDQIAMYITQEDGTTEYADGVMEMIIVKD